MRAPVCMCVFFFFINVCDNNKDSLHRLSQAVSLDFKVI